MSQRFTPEEYFRLKTDFLKLKSALHDHNTDLASYHARLGELRSHFESVRRMGVLSVSVGEISQVESIYGWQVFDEVLRTVARTLLAMCGQGLPGSSIVALDGVGAEHFVVFVPADAQGGEVTAALLEALAASTAAELERAFQGEAFRSMAPRPRFRVGHAIFADDPFHRFERLVYRAIGRARGAVDAGRDRRRSRYEEELRRILAEGEIEIVFQPIHALAGGEILGYEALSRGPEGTPFRDPRLMFDASEDLGLGAEMDALCLRRAILSAGNLAGGGCKLFVNALPSTLLTAVGPPLEWIERAGLSPGDVVVEVTERGPVEDREGIARGVAELRRCGLGVALDDIGTGLTGLQAISEMKPDFLKLDVSLVHNIQSNLVTQDLLCSLIRVARAIGARVVGEGVETEQERETLRECGTDFAQGFLYSRPSPGPAS